MSQNLRVALWVPQIDPTVVGEAIRTKAAPSANKRIASEFAVISGGSGSGGIEEAPLDGKVYVRQTGLWVELDGGTF